MKLHPASLLTFVNCTNISTVCNRLFKVQSCDRDWLSVTWFSINKLCFCPLLLVHAYMCLLQGKAHQLFVVFRIMLIK